MPSGNTLRVERLKVSAFKIPTDAPESDGTFAWDSTTLVLVEAHAAGNTGIGYSYADTAAATLIKDTLAEVVRGRDVMAVPGQWVAMVQAIRNLGRPGIASMAIAAVDTALWDLKARILDMPWSRCLARSATACRFTAAAASLRIPLPTSSSNSAAGPTTASRA